MMRPTFRKLEVKDIGQLEKLVADNMEGVALDFTADEALLLRVMDAYSWCLEFPDTVRRLYPMAQISTARPPRILFIVERLTDSFLRRIKQLSFLEIDCLEFRHLEVNGESVIFFDHVERLRKTAAESPVEAQAPVAAPAARVIEPRLEPVRQPVRSEVVRAAMIEAPQPVPAPQPVIEVVRPSAAEGVRPVVVEATQPVAEVVRPTIAEAV